MTTGQLPTRHRRAVAGRVSVIGVLGELFVTIGVFIFLFLGWQLWLNDLVVGQAQRTAAATLSRELSAAPRPAAIPSPVGSPSGVPDPTVASSAPLPAPLPAEPVVTATVSETTPFATIYIPRFGADYVRTIAEGVSASNTLRTAIGHYPGTQMPGEIGNFALAGHRTTYGAPFNLIGTLQVGDKIYVQTADGWYTYVFRSLEYVRPTVVQVLEPAPQIPGAAPTDRILTMTSCNPQFSAAERIIAYSVFDSWQPASAGPPAAIAGLVTGGA